MKQKIIPLALAARFGGGLDELGVLPATGSTTLTGGRLLLLHGSGGSRRGAPTAMSRLRGSRLPLAHDVFDRLSLLLCCQKLLGKALDSVAEEAGHGTREHSGPVPSPAPSCQRDTARDGAPGPLAWTSHYPETVRSPSSLEARGPSQHAAHVEPPGRDHPRAGLSGLWPGGPAVTPWRGGQNLPTHRLYKHCQLDLTNTYRPMRGDTGHPAGW